MFQGKTLRGQNKGEEWEEGTRKGQERTLHSPKTENGRPNDRQDPMHPRIRREPKPEQPNGDQRRTHDERRQLILGLPFGSSCLLLPLLHGLLLHPGPDWRGRSCQHDGNKQTQKAQTDLPEVESVIVTKHQRESAEEEVKNTEEDGRINVED